MCLEKDGDSPSVEVILRAELSPKGQLDSLRKGIPPQREVVHTVRPGAPLWDRVVDLSPNLRTDGVATLFVNQLWTWQIEGDAEVLELTSLDRAFFWLPFPTVEEYGGPIEWIDEYPSVERLVEIEESNRASKLADLERVRREELPIAIEAWEQTLNQFVVFCRACVDSWLGSEIPDAELTFRRQKLTPLQELLDREEIGALGPDESREIRRHLVSLDEEFAQRERRRLDRLEKRQTLREAEEWVPRYGSSRLKKAKDLGLLEASLGVYRDERLERERPGWHWARGIEELKPILNPAEDALDLLAEARKWDEAAVLRWKAIRKDGSGYAVVVATFLGRTIEGTPGAVAKAIAEAGPTYDYGEEPF